MSDSETDNAFQARKQDRLSKELAKHPLKKPKNFLCYGVRSRTEDGKHAVLMDFDDVDKGDIILQLMSVQVKYRLSDIFIMENSEKPGYYHAYCATKVPLEEYLQILSEVDIDENFTIPLKKWEVKTTILRFSGKGRMRHTLTLLSNTPNWRRSSLGHLKFLNKVFNVDIQRYKNTDKLSTVTIDRYTTGKA